MGFSDIMGLRYNPDIAYVNIFNDGRFNNSMWVLPKFVLAYGFIMQVLYMMYIGILDILYHNMGIVMRIPSHNIEQKPKMHYIHHIHFGFLFNNECL
jgi:sterol desaturase/sphingolipid hydroxylase (fatty acid hydroxylase superfamily)